MKNEWDASLTFGLSSTRKRLLYVLGETVPGALQGVEGRAEAVSSEASTVISAQHAGMVPAPTQQRRSRFSEHEGPVES